MREGMSSRAPAGSVVLLASDCDSTRVIYRALARELSVERVILESSVPRARLLRRRAKKLGLRAAASQAAFVAVVVPILRAASRRRLSSLRSPSRRKASSASRSSAAVTRTSNRRDSLGQPIASARPR